MSHAGPVTALLDSREKGHFRPEITDVRIARSVLLLALLAAAAQGAEVYRSKTADGSVIYSDRPTERELRARYDGRAATRQRRARAPAPDGRARLGGARRQCAPGGGDADAIATGPTSTELRAERQKNCDTSKERQQRYDLSRRLFKTNDKGEREYLDDKAVAEARAKAAQDVKDWCG